MSCAGIGALTMRASTWGGGEQYWTDFEAFWAAQNLAHMCEEDGGLEQPPPVGMEEFRAALRCQRPAEEVRELWYHVGCTNFLTGDQDVGFLRMLRASPDHLLQTMEATGWVPNSGWEGGVRHLRWRR